MKQGAKVKCPNCGQEFQISKSAEQNDREKCPKCDSTVLVIKKGKKVDVRLLESQSEDMELEINEPEAYEF